MNHGAMPLAVGKKKGATVLKNKKCEELLRDEVAGAFTPSKFPPTELAPTSTQLTIKCLKIIFLLSRKKDNIVETMKQYHTKHVSFLVL